MAQVAVKENRSERKTHLIYEDGKIIRTTREQNWSKVKYILPHHCEYDLLEKEVVLCQNIRILMNKESLNKEFDSVFKTAFEERDFEKWSDLRVENYGLVYAEYIEHATKEELYDSTLRIGRIHYRFYIDRHKCDLYIAEGWREGSNMCSFVFTDDDDKYIVKIYAYQLSIQFAVNLLLYIYKATHDEKALEAIMQFLKQSRYYNDKDSEGEFNVNHAVGKILHTFAEQDKETCLNLLKEALNSKRENKGREIPVNLYCRCPFERTYPII